MLYNFAKLKHISIEKALKKTMQIWDLHKLLLYRPLRQVRYLIGFVLVVKHTNRLSWIFCNYQILRKLLTTCCELAMSE